MKTTITSLLGIIAMIFISCSNEPKKVATKTFQLSPRPAQPVEVLTTILNVEVSAVAILPDGKEVEVKKFDTPPTQEINGIAHLKVSDTSDIALDLPIKGIAHVTISTDTGLKVLKLPYHMQRKGDLISPTCGNSFSTKTSVENPTQSAQKVGFLKKETNPAKEYKQALKELFEK